MDPKEINPINIETQDLMLQKLADIENILTMRLQQARNQGVDNRDDIELVQQLLAKIANATPQIKKVSSAAEFVTNFIESIKGDPGENGKNCDPLEVAAILKESEDFLNLVKGEKGDSVKGDPGEPGKPGENGKTPKKGEDYMTDSDVQEVTKTVLESVKKDVLSYLENGVPLSMKSSLREFVNSELFSEKVQKITENRKPTVKDIVGLSEAIKSEMETVYENVREYTRRSGGGNPQLGKMEDIDWNTIGDGLAIKWDATKKKFVFGTAGGGAVASVNGQTGTVVLTTSDISEGSNLYFTNARAIGALTGQNISMFTNNAGYITSVAGGDHGTLSGLGDDDHAQYALLAGRSGGQTIKGGTAVTDVLTLVGTSGNGTLTSPAVQVKVGNNGATTAITVLNNGNVGIGTASPSQKLDVRGGNIFINTNGSAADNILIGDAPGSGFPGIWLGSAATSPTYSNYTFLSDGANGALFNAASGAIQRFRINNAAVMTVGGNGVNIGGTDGAAPSYPFQVHTSSSDFVVLSSGNVGIGTTTPTAKLDINSDVLRLRTAKTPATSGASGNQGDIAWDSGYIYVCVATNTWERAALSTW